MVRIVAPILLVLSTCLAATGRAQHMFVDVDGDQAATPEDRLTSEPESSLDVWLVTDKLKDGSRSALRTPNGGYPTINSYTFILRASGGTVEWGSYTNAIHSMDIALGTFSSRTDFATGFGGGELPLPPGRYLLGSLPIRVISGDPRIDIVDSTPLEATATTSFGSAVPGADEDNTLKFRVERPAVGDTRTKRRGDWFEATGVASRGVNTARAIPSESPGLRFRIQVSPNPANPETKFLVTTTRPGPVRVTVYDLQGRLVRSLTGAGALPAGSHTFTLGEKGTEPRLRSGVYFYRIVTAEKTASGKLLIIK